MSQDLSITVRFHPPPADLCRYFTTFYITEIRLPPGEVVRDSLQPEWANLRLFQGAFPHTWIDGGCDVAGTPFTATGPSTRNTNFTLGTSRIWGIGLIPLGWSRFVGKPAHDHANLIADGLTHPSFTQFIPLARSLFRPEPDEFAELDRIIAFFRKLNAAADPDEARITAIHAALIDPQIDTVAALVARVGIGQRTVERICERSFGFRPKTLLRRQRFMRSLTQFMLDPSLKWIGAMDSHYHDQAQFVRDFHEFMGCTPREYATTPHPVLEKFMRERGRVHGSAVQTLDRPEGHSAVA